MKKENKIDDPILNIWLENKDQAIREERYEDAVIWRDRINERVKKLLKKLNDELKNEGNEL